MNVSSVPYTAELAAFAANATLAIIPSTLLTLLPFFILDTVSAMLAGVVQPVYQSAVEVVGITYGHGSGEAIHLAIDGTASSLSGAMLLNGIAAGDLEFEHVVSNAHPASAMFPALLSVASAFHKTGEELLVAMAVGYELATRIGAASTTEVETERGFHNPGLNGDLATAAAVGHLMGSDSNTIASAMGLAASSSAGLLAFINTGAMTKRLHPARAGQLGAEAAFLAHAGVDGPQDILENPDGFLHAFSPNPEPTLLIEDLGSKWTGENMVLKLAPVHAYAQVFVYAVNSYRSGANRAWNAVDIQNVTIYSGPGVLQPSHRIVHPDTLVSAQYSVPFGIAASLTIDLRDPLMFNDSLLVNPVTQSISGAMQFVQISDDPNFVGGFLAMNVGGQNVNITADEYPGIPGSIGFVNAVEDKYEQIIKALDISLQGAALRAKIASVGALGDVKELLSDLVSAGSAAARRFNYSGI